MSEFPSAEVIEDDPARPAPRDRTWPRDWMPDFFAAMAALPDVTAATRHAGVSRQTVYRWRNSDEPFAEAWDECLEIAKDTLQRQARTWAVSGMERTETTTTTVEKVNGTGEVTSRTTTTVTKVGVDRSPAMLIFMLKAWLPDRYRWADRVAVGGDEQGEPIRLLSGLDDIDERIATLTAELEARSRADGSPPVPVE